MLAEIFIALNNHSCDWLLLPLLSPFPLPLLLTTNKGFPPGNSRGSVDELLSNGMTSLENDKAEDEREDEELGKVLSSMTKSDNTWDTGLHKEGTMDLNSAKNPVPAPAPTPAPAPALPKHRLANKQSLCG